MQYTLTSTQRAPSSKTYSNIGPKPRKIILDLINETIQLHEELDTAMAQLSLELAIDRFTNTDALEAERENNAALKELNRTQLAAFEAEKKYAETQMSLVEIREKSLETHEATIKAQSDVLERKERDIAELETRLEAQDVQVEQQRAETEELKKQLEKAQKTEQKMKKMRDALKPFMAALSE